MKPEGRFDSLRPLATGLLLAIALILANMLLPSSWRETVVERSYDLTSRAGTYLAANTPLPVPVVVVDIDSETLNSQGTWPWPRSRLAKLVEAVSGHGPATLAIDMLLPDADQRSPLALARRLAAETGREDIKTLAAELPDPDERLAAALARVPSVLGFVLDPARPGQIPGVPILARDRASLRPHWSGAGAIGPYAPFYAAIAGLGMIGLPGDADGIVRRVPLFVSAGDDVLPGLALEAIRVWQKSTAYILDQSASALRVGELVRALPNGAMLRLAPPPERMAGISRISAHDLMASPPRATIPAGAIVFLGGSAPELGGLRASSDEPLVASVMIQAQAAVQLIRGKVPLVPARDAMISAGMMLVAMAVALIVALTLGPLAGTLVMLGGCATLFGIAVGLFIWFDLLVEPFFPALGAMITFGLLSIATFAQTRRREARVRRRFEQHLAPQVVSMIVANPDLLRLRGERRQITALFTDVESFTAMTERADPEVLVRVLDAYFEGVTGIVIAHGGMVDKLVGDAVHALFNVPFDQVDHARKAVACAVAIRDWTATFREAALPAGLGFGRTRIGIETGEAIVGDIGLGSKLDYTAHGTVMNTAARLEAANKVFGSSICLGPQVAALCEQDGLRELGTIELRGLSKPVMVREPWPETADPAWRRAYRDAAACIGSNTDEAIARFEALARLLPCDAVVRQTADRLRCSTGNSA